MLGRDFNTRAWRHAGVRFLLPGASGTPVQGLLRHETRAAPEYKMVPAALEPAIPGSAGRCIIHWATARCQRRASGSPNVASSFNAFSGHRWKVVIMSADWSCAETATRGLEWADSESRVLTVTPRSLLRHIGRLLITARLVAPGPVAAAETTTTN